MRWLKTFPQRAPVDYDQFRPNIQSGDLLFCSGSGYFSQMIQRATKSAWSHVAFVMRLDDVDRVMVLESVEPQGVRTVPLSKYLRNYDNKNNPYPGGVLIARHADFKDKVTPQRLHRFGQFAVDLFGYPYDRDEIAKIAYRIMTGKRRARRTDPEYIRPAAKVHIL